MNVMSIIDWFCIGVAAAWLLVIVWLYLDKGL
jgi:hypothetical protein